MGRMNEMTMPPGDGVPPHRRSKRLAIWLCAILGVLIIGLVAWWWWANRPIHPTVLTAQEKQVVEQKVEALQNTDTPPPADPQAQDDGPVYEKGGKEIVLTEREINGLLNENTDLGKSVKFELARDAVHARVETDLDPDLPILGGRKLKAKARFIVKENNGMPSLIIDDVTVWGISLPNDWLGGLKGQDVLSKVLGTKGGKISGIEEFRIEPGKLTLKLSE